ncbi:MAG: hypothetical protein JWM09_439 [Francisellaceae bacterium]|nr:hypothetical protein [Francisellaceae bacterium]
MAVFSYQIKLQDYINRTYHKLNGIKDVQWGLERIKQDLEQGGYQGPNSKNSYTSLYVHTPIVIPRDINNSILIIKGYDANKELEFLNTIRSKTSHSKLNIYLVPKKSSYLIETCKDLNSPLLVKPEFMANSAHKSRLILISNGLQSDLFMTYDIKSLSKGTEIYHYNPLSHLYEKGSEVINVESIEYFVGYSGHHKWNKRTGKQEPIYTLFRNNQYKTEPIIDFINDFTVLYGIRNPLNPTITYRQADKVNDWSEVEAIRVKISIDCENDNEITQENDFYIYNQTIKF